MSINYVKLVLLSVLLQAVCSIDLLKDTLKESSKKFINFDLSKFDRKLVCLQFKYLSTDSNENQLLKLYLINKKTNDFCEKLWSSKLSFNKQKINEELNLDTEILDQNIDDYQLQFRILNNQDEFADQLSIDDVLDVNSIRIRPDFCQSRYKCFKNDCLWSTFKNETQVKSIIKLKNQNSKDQNLIDNYLIEKLNLNLVDNNVYFLIHNKNQKQLNETIYSPVLKLPINLKEIEISFDCKSLRINCLPNENVFVDYKIAQEYYDPNNRPKRLIKFDKKIDKFIFKLNSNDFIAKHVDVVFTIKIKLNSNQTMVLSNIEVKNHLSKDLDWRNCNFEKSPLFNRSIDKLPCNLEQFNSYDTDQILNWFVVNENRSSTTPNYIKLLNDRTKFHLANELYLPRVLLNGDNENCVFKFKFNIQKSDVNLFVYFVDDHHRQVKIYEKNEDILMIDLNEKNVLKNNWTDISIYLGNIYRGFRLLFSTDQLNVNDSIAIGDLKFENCHFNQSTIKTKRPNELDIIRITYEEPKPLVNENSVFKCNFEHTTLEECGLFQDELLEETCPEETCTPSEFLKSLDNFNGPIDFQLPFRDKSKNFGTNGHYIYLQNVNSNGKIVRAILRFKRTLSNRIYSNNSSNNSSNSSSNSSSINSSDKANFGICKMKFYLRTNGYSLVYYDIFVDLLTTNKLISIKTKPQFSKLNFYELNEVSFENIKEPFQVLIQGSIRHNHFDQDTFIYMAIDDLSFNEDCQFL